MKIYTCFNFKTTKSKNQHYLDLSWSALRDIVQTITFLESHPTLNEVFDLYSTVASVLAWAYKTV